MSQVDPGKLSGVLAVLGQSFYKNGQRTAVPRSTIEEELEEDIRDELLLLQAGEVAEIFSNDEDMHVDLSQENMRAALSEREKLEKLYDGNLEEMLENESPTFIDYPEGEPDMEPDFNEKVPGKFFYDDYAGLVATVGSFGERENPSWNQIAGYINENPDPHLEVLQAVNYVQEDPLQLTEDRYRRDAERIHSFIEENYDGFTHEFIENFEEEKQIMDSLLETIDLSYI